MTGGGTRYRCAPRSANNRARQPLDPVPPHRAEKRRRRRIGSPSFVWPTISGSHRGGVPPFHRDALPRRERGALARKTRIGDRSGRSNRSRRSLSAPLVAGVTSRLHLQENLKPRRLQRSTGRSSRNRITVALDEHPLPPKSICEFASADRAPYGVPARSYPHNRRARRGTGHRQKPAPMSPHWPARSDLRRRPRQWQRMIAIVTVSRR
jgi:hypothetical protein